MQLVEEIVTRQAEMQAIRRDIHAYPELGFKEFRTADLIAEKLAEWGIPCDRGLGGTGVVGIVKTGTSTRAIGLRADIDALPITELNKFAHASRHEGRMHACGHDGHTAMLLGAAKYLCETRNFDGTVLVIFQPAEEGGGGGREMVADGIMERWNVTEVYGMHNWPGRPVGTFSIR
ncbi:MAG: amidohydrolase, partial [Gammaproteobacteria bacterium]